MSQARMGGVGAVLADELERARVRGLDVTKAVLVEGASDRAAVERLAARLGRDLRTEGVMVVAIAGATNIDRFLKVLGPSGHDVELSGLCDRAEAAAFAFALDRAGIGDDVGVSDLDKYGFFVCDGDLEEELIRAVGSPGVLRVMGEQGQLRSFRRFQNQPAQRDKTIEAQIWRWMGNHKIRYAPLLVEAVRLDRVPRPLQALIDNLNS